MSEQSNDAENAVLVVQGEEDAVQLVKEAIDSHKGSESEMTGRRNLDGSAAAWIVVATLSVQALPQVLTFLKDLLQMHKIKTIKVGDIEIENPTAQLVEELSSRMRLPLAGKSP
jgi:hypothetical protein